MVGRAAGLVREVEEIFGFGGDDWGNSNEDRREIEVNEGRELQLIQLLEEPMDVLLNEDGGGESEGGLQLVVQLLKGSEIEENNVRVGDPLMDGDSQWVLDNVRKVSGLVGLEFGGSEGKTWELFREIENKRIEEREERVKKKGKGRLEVGLKG